MKKCFGLVPLFGSAGWVGMLENIGWLLVGKSLRVLLVAIGGVWVARYLGPEAFGRLSYAASFVSIFAGLAGMGLHLIVVRELVRDPGSLGVILASALFLRLGGGLLAFVLAQVVIHHLRPDDRQVVTIIAIVGLTLLLDTSDIVKFWLEAQVLSKYVVWVENAVLVVAFSVRVGLIVSHSSLSAFAYVLLLESLLVAFGLLVVYWRLDGPVLRFRLGVAGVRALFRHTWPLLIASITTLAYMRVDQIMLGEFQGDMAVGVYTAGCRLSELWYFVPVAINATLLPAMLTLWHSSPERFMARLSNILSMMVWLSLSVAVAVTLGAESVINLLFGDSYSDAADVLVVHVWAGIFVSLNNTLWAWFIAQNKQAMANLRLMAGLVLNVLLNYFWIPSHGVVGAAWATLISRVVVAYFGLLLRSDTRVLFVLMSKVIFSGGMYGFVGKSGNQDH